MEQEQAGRTGTFHTTDIALAAWLKMRSNDEGITVLFKDAVQKAGKKFVFIFDDPDNQARGLAVGFVNSDCHRYDSEMRALKLICHRR